MVRAVARALAARGIQVRVVQGEQHLITLGDVRAPWWQRLGTRSRHIRLGSARGVLTSARARSARAPGVLPDASLVPPGTLLPLLPTLGRRRGRDRPTTTHDPARGGGPRLVFAVGNPLVPPDRRRLVSAATTTSPPSAAARTATWCSRAWHRCTPRCGTTSATSSCWSRTPRRPGCTGRRWTAGCCAPARGCSSVPVHPGLRGVRDQHELVALVVPHLGVQRCQALEHQVAVRAAADGGDVVVQPHEAAAGRHRGLPTANTRRGPRHGRGRAWWSDGRGRGAARGAAAAAGCRAVPGRRPGGPRACAEPSRAEVRTPRRCRA